MVTKDTDLVFLAVRQQLKYLRKRKKLSFNQTRLNEIQSLLKIAERAPAVMLDQAVTRAAEDIHPAEHEDAKKYMELGSELFHKPLFLKCTYTYSIEINTYYGPAIKHVVIYVDIEKMTGVYLWKVDLLNKNRRELPNLAFRSGFYDFSLKAQKCDKGYHTAFNHSSAAKGKSLNDDDPCMHSAFINKTIEIGPGATARLLDQPDGDITMVTQLQDRVVGDTFFLSHALAWLHVNDYFPFSVTDAKKYKEYIRKSSGDPAITKIVFLNKLPESRHPQKASVGDHGSKSGHQRKGYWVTLSAERFKDHPMYRVYKGVYRQPTWVGPTSTEYEGNIYKVLLPGEDFDQKLK